MALTGAQEYEGVIIPTWRKLMYRAAVLADIISDVTGDRLAHPTDWDDVEDLFIADGELVFVIRSAPMAAGHVRDLWFRCPVGYLWSADTEVAERESDLNAERLLVKAERAAKRAEDQKARIIERARSVVMRNPEAFADLLLRANITG